MRRCDACALAVVAAVTTQAGASPSAEVSGCDKPLYLTFDTGHMGIAPLVAQVLKRQDVRVTFFAANERTQEGDGSLGNHWAPWWKARSAEGHEFASHTYDHVYWRQDLPGTGSSFRMKPSAGPQQGLESTWSAEQYCKQISRASQRLAVITGKPSLPLFRAPGGKTSAKLLGVARDCGYAHVGWSATGFLGDELPSEAFSNIALLKKALGEIRPGNILLAHLGIWSRQDPWAPANLEPLIVGLKSKGFCFKTLREHPDYRRWMEGHTAGVSFD